MKTDMTKSRYLSAYNKGKEEFKESIWHKGIELPAGEKCVFFYNPVDDSYDIAYYLIVPENAYWAYLEDFFNKEMYDAVLKREKELDKQFEEEGIG